MTKIFISYRRADSSVITGRIYDRLCLDIGKNNIFKDVNNIGPGVDFREVLTQAANECSVMLVIIGPHWVRAADAEGQPRLHDPEDFVRLEVEMGLERDDVIVVPVLVSGAMPPQEHELPDSLKELAFNNARPVRDDPDFHSDIDHLLNELKEPLKLNTGSRTRVWALAIPIVVASLVLAILIPFLSSQANTQATQTAQSPQAAQTQAALALTPSETPLPSATFTPSSSPTPPATETPVPTLLIAFMVQTLDSQSTLAWIQATNDQATAWIENTAIARATGFAIGTQSLRDQTATATQWTQTPTPTITPTPNVTASIEALRAEQGATGTAESIEHMTATAASWTATPTNTPTLSPEQIALTPVAQNSEWVPVERDFNGVTMVLVPAGCFMMGSSAYADERPVHQQCFTAPFWIDKYEVTNEQFANFGGQARRRSYRQDPLRPRESITWAESRNFCLLREARLPTEVEWEYAARGPSNLLFPWGAKLESPKLVWSSTAKGQTAAVGSRPEGQSWVGAMDLSGNVWEAVNTLYKPYAYSATDGREEDPSNSNTLHVLRGGAWDNNFQDNFRTTTRLKAADVPSLTAIGFRCARGV